MAATRDGVTGLAWVAGRIVPLGQARVPLLDRGHLLGDGVFETMRARAGRLVFAAAHAERLRAAVNLLGLPPAVAEAAFAGARKLAKAPARGLGENRIVRIQVTSGVGADLVGAPGRHAVTGLARPFVPYPARSYEQGLQLAMAALRKDAASPWGAVKTTSFLPHIAARREAKAAGADDALLLNGAGHACEATTSNVVAVRDGALYAPGPEEGAVDGVTRRIVLEEARAEGLLIHMTLPMPELGGASECFLTNSIGGLVPVARIASMAFQPVPGPVTRALAARYAARLDAETATPSRSGAARRSALQRPPG